MATTNSFDVTSTVDLQEVDNAVNQARKEITQRYDFKGSPAAIELDQKNNTLTLTAEDRFKLGALWEVLQTRMVRRNVPVQNLKLGDVEDAAGGTARQVVTLQMGIPSETAREIVKVLKDAKMKKVQAAIQGDQVRISSASRDDLQAAIQLLRDHDFGIALQLGTIDREGDVPGSGRSRAGVEKTERRKNGEEEARRKGPRRKGPAPFITSRDKSAVTSCLRL